MDETLGSEVAEKVREILGSCSNLGSEVEQQLREQKRYTLFADDKKGLGCVIGYWFPNENPEKPVWVGIELDSATKNPAHGQIIHAFQGWRAESKGSWESGHRSGEKEWEFIRKGKSIQSFIGGEDHVRVVKNHLLDLLEEVKEFKKAYPNLPWNSPLVETQSQCFEQLMFHRIGIP